MSETKGRLRLCAVSDVHPGDMIAVDVAGLPRLVVYRIGAQFYCSQDECTHGAASLCDEGELDGYTIECGWHGGKFDVRTGEVCAPPCTEPLRIFPVTVENNDLFIDLS